MLDHNSMNDLRVAWRKAIRRLWKLPYTTHCKLLPDIAMQMPIDVSIYKRFSKHFVSGLFHKNKSVSGVFKSSLFYNSRLSNNFRYIAKHCDMYSWNVFNEPIGAMPEAVIKKFNKSSHEDNIRIAKQIRELCDRRDRYPEEWLLDRSDVDFILKFLCTE